MKPGTKEIWIGTFKELVINVRKGILYAVIYLAVRWIAHYMMGMY